jgi:hypothetical protein
MQSTPLRTVSPAEALPAAAAAVLTWRRQQLLPAQQMLTQLPPAQQTLTQLPVLLPKHVYQALRMKTRDKVK